MMLTMATFLWGTATAGHQNEGDNTGSDTWFAEHVTPTVDLPPEIRELERATLEAAAKAAGVERYRLGNVVLPEEFGAIEDGFAAGHLAAKAAIKSRRPERPVGFSLAVVDDQAVGDSTVRDRKRAEVYERWLRLARDDDYIGVQNYEVARYDGKGALPPPKGAARRHGLGHLSVVAGQLGALRACRDGRAGLRDRARHRPRRRPDDLRAKGKTQCFRVRGNRPSNAAVGAHPTTCDRSIAI
jgi:beta-glucosidase